MRNYSNSILTQGGGALIIMLVILVLAGTTALLSTLDASGVSIERDKKTAIILAEAKDTLIGLSIQATSGGTRPGDLIRPDTASETTPDYNGTADASCLDSNNTDGLPMVSGGSGVNMRCLGRLPWKDLGISIHVQSKSNPSDYDPAESDPSGIMPWYAVSANLVDPTCLTILNSDTLSLVYTPPPATLDCSGSTLPYPWLTVRDGNGNIVNDRVAAIILIPGEPRGGQSRSSTALTTPSQFLDTLIVPTDCAIPCIPGIYSNADMDNDFIIASANTRYASANNFNDQLVYITIDELMANVEKRSAQEAASQLRSYYLASSTTPAYRFYPYAASLGVTDNACVENKLNGLLPLLSAASSCTSSSNCSSNFSRTPTVSFTHTCTGNYTAKTGLCNFSGKTCICTGAGECTRNPLSNSNSCTGLTRLRKFSCDANGNCNSNIPGEFLYDYSPPSTDNSIATGSCTIGGSSTITCNGSGSFSITNCTHPNKILTGLPAWFTDNHWQDVMYYEISSDCSFGMPGCATGSLTIGAKTNNHALIVSSGQKLATQYRPSTLITDYLDSGENTDGNSIYDKVGKPKTSTYNDQMFIVAP